MQPTTKEEPNQVLTIVLILIGLALGIARGMIGCDTGGRYAGGEGSSHKGGHYQNRSTENHYRSRQ